jgi:integrase
MDNSLKRPGTRRTYDSLFNKWVLPITETGPIDEAGFYICVNYWKNNSKLAPRTIKILIRLMCNEVKLKYGVDLPRVETTKQIMRNLQEPEIKALSKDNVSRLVEACRNTELFTPVIIALHTGMRRGEVFGLRWGEVDILKREIHVNRSYAGPTKSGKSRVVPISSTLEKELLAIFPMKADNSSKSLVIARNFDPNPGLQGACRRIGIEPINFHALRHTFATLALEAGRSPRKVQQVLGHTALSTTLNCYWSVTQEKMDVEFMA